MLGLKREQRMSAVGGASGDRDARGEEAGGGHTREGACLNCGVTLAGDYCHACGQKAHVHRTLGAFWHDLLHGVLHFEGKTWRTLPMLAWRPGELTRRYIEGERVRFVSPMALFLFSVFLMFAVFNSLGGPFVVTAMPQEQVERIQRLNVRSEVLAGEIATLQRERSRLVAASRPTNAVDAQLADLARSNDAIEADLREIGLRRGSEPGNQTVRSTPPNTGWPWLDYALAKYAKNPSL
ncbi:MAG TPA: DUF3667 domain-containing protein, partial [Allosphingosinicella sp.]